MPKPKPTIGITMGDPAGIGPEILVRALTQKYIRSICKPVVFGNTRFLANVRLKPAIGEDQNVIRFPLRGTFRNERFKVVEVETPDTIPIGKKSAASGKAALGYLDKAIGAALNGEISALVTAPVSKSAIRDAGIPGFTGHTEYLAHKTGARSVAMMFYSNRLKVALVTTHLPLREVASSLNASKILDVIVLGNEALAKLGSEGPRIGVAGLNPHAGEEEAFGDEDQRIVAPAVRMAREKGIDAQGPLPADTLFRAAYNRHYDLVVAMYHDQALAPFKMVASGKGVNLTLGLPFVRTSVDHGTAYDIADKGIASEKSLVEAIKLAVRLAK